jgi:L-threonylcarbamoyladenylate synthase
VLRPGAITHAQLERALGVAVAHSRMTSRETTAQLAPGLLRRHYSPRTPLVLHDRLPPPGTRAGAAGEAWVFLARPPGRRRTNVFWLDARGDLRGAARRLFALLRQLDEAGFARIHFERAPDRDGLAHAINDRLERAAARGEVARPA